MDNIFKIAKIHLAKKQLPSKITDEPDCPNQTYTVTSGDTCFNLAQSLCDSGLPYTQIFKDANNTCSGLQIGDEIQYNCCGWDSSLPDLENHNTTYVVQDGDTCSDLKTSLCKNKNTVFCSDDKCTSDNNLQAGELIEYNCTGTCNKLLDTKRFIVDGNKTIDGSPDSGTLDTCYNIVSALCPNADPMKYDNIICKATEPGPQTCGFLNRNARIYYNCSSTSKFNDCPNSFNNNYGTYIVNDGDDCSKIVEDICGPGTGTRVFLTNAICKKTFEENSNNYNPNNEKWDFCTNDLKKGNKVYYDCSTLDQGGTMFIYQNIDGDRCPATTAPTTAPTPS